MAEIKDGFDYIGNPSLTAAQIRQGRITEDNRKRIAQEHAETRRRQTNTELKVLENKTLPPANNRRKKTYKKRKIDKKKLIGVLVATATLVTVAGIGINSAVDNYKEYKEEQKLEAMFVDNSYNDEYLELTKEVREEISQAVSDATKYDSTNLYESSTVNHKVIADCINNSKDPQKYMSVFITEYAEKGKEGILSNTAYYVDFLKDEGKTGADKLEKFVTGSNKLLSDPTDSEFLKLNTIKYAEEYKKDIVLNSIANKQEGGINK